jgi:hypothetical protein
LFFVITILIFKILYNQIQKCPFRH